MAISLTSLQQPRGLTVVENKSTPGKAYSDYVADIVESLGADAGLRAAVGGDFVATGILELQLLKSLGLAGNASVIDVGCGSGRLAFQLSQMPGVRYLGTDVVPKLLDYAKKLCNRPDWEFRRADDCAIPAPDDSADFVCFFSVFTHLLHEQSFRYLKEAARVLKPEGRIVLSFLEFRLNAHWQVFEDSIDAPEQHLNQFIEREAIHTWARRLGLVVETCIDGDKPSIPIDGELVWPDGTIMSGRGNLGQSIAVLCLPGQAQMRPEGGVQPQDVCAMKPVAARTTDTGDQVICSASVRGCVDKSDAVLIAGFTLGCSTDVLIVASGHSLTTHGIRNILAAPHLLIYDSAGEVINESRGWRHLAQKQLEAAQRAMRRFGLPEPDETGDDCLIVMKLDAGTYSMVVRPRSDRGGIVHLQVLPISVA